MARDKAKYKYHNVVTGFALQTRGGVDSFMDALKTFLNQGMKQATYTGKPCNVVVSVVSGEDHFGPMVDLEWACSALPMSKDMLRHYLCRYKLRFDPAVYRRVKRPDFRNQRTRLLSLHDLRVLRGLMLMKSPGKQYLLDRGDIE